MTTNKEFGKQLEKRTKAFAVRIIKLTSCLPHHREADTIARQIVRSGTSVGANYREANRAVSRADFRHRISICEKKDERDSILAGSDYGSRLVAR